MSTTVDAPATTDREVLRARIKEAIEAERDHLREVGETIRLNPELGYEEYQASQLLADSLKEAGFEVEKPYGGVETAFKAVRRGKTDGPTVAVLAEYDALAGIGHGCGHNLIAISGLANAIGLGAVLDELPGNIAIIGCPAEEGGGGKVKLLDAGAFDDIDAALMIHHAGDRSGAALNYPDGTSLATSGMAFEFFGAPAHAAADPYNGVNALNAVIETFNGINALRQHVRMDARIHGIITNGGEASNVVPKYARCQFGVRAADADYLDGLVEKVRNIARGAALITGCEVKITMREHPYQDKRPSYTVGRRFTEHMEAAGMDLSKKPSGRGMASTDFGNVTHRIPGVTGSFAISHEPIPGHSQEVLDASGSDFGYDQAVKVSTAMAWTALDLILDAELLAEAKDEVANWTERYARSN